MSDIKVLSEFRADEPILDAAKTRSDAGVWLADGTVTFRVKGFPANEAKMGARLEYEVYGKFSGVEKLGEQVAAEISLGFQDASSGADAFQQAALQLKEIAELLLKQADGLISKSD